MTLRNILVATDFSEDAEGAVRAAASLAKGFGARLHVHHALEVPLPLLQPYEVAVPELFIGEVRKSAREKLDQLHSSLTAKGIDTEVSLGEVPAAHSITDQALATHADLVVVGSRGHTGLSRVVLGSVAEAAVRAAPCSVLTVRGDADPASPRTILLACDFSEGGELAREQACALADQSGADLHLVHAMTAPVTFASPYEIPVPVDYTDAIERAANERIAEIAQQCRIKGKVTTALATGAAHAVINAEAERVGADCIVTGSRGLRGLKHIVLGSVAQRTLRTAPCSVWTVRPTAASEAAG